MRLFVALIPPQEALEDLDDFLDVRREAGPFRWTQSDQVHVTLAFLADAPERSLDDLVERLGRAAGRRTRFETAIAGGGAFPDAARARVLWAGLSLGDDGRTELDRMATGARAAAARSGIEVGGQRFRPHLTVARLGRPQEATRWVRLLDAYRGPSWTASSISLVQSHLGEGPRNRPRYEVLEEFALSG
ncbi:2'-5' RNA ligase [Nocardioides terrae]|uniref:RNA 2',3'-cyclic phosphodiesterase n=1 Tax=Nocardioides terrae TaxID=574651 RepID=A0A1I1EXI8_9ACTN|nr:RNA 2',3'-cyclic phosphodiesterase [Nocardioides terrae]SFB91741.1 2'-5' RNA ligase [Nocardioides terrae]